MKNAYLGLALLGTVVPYSFLVPWLAANGLDLPGLVAELFSTRIGAFFGVDVVVSALALFAFMYAERAERAVNRRWIPVMATLLVGVSCGLPLYLFLRHRDARAT